MKTILIVFGILVLLGLAAFLLGIYKAPILEDSEDYLLRNNPNYLGQGHWIKK